MSKFTRFNKKQIFTIDASLFKRDDITDQYIFLKAQDIFKMDNEHSEPHLLVGFWKHDTPIDLKEEYPGLPDYTYTLGIKIGDEYYYTNAPAHMNQDFDAISRDSSLIKEINDGHCAICAYRYTKIRNKKELVFYGFEFC